MKTLRILAAVICAGVWFGGVARGEDGPDVQALLKTMDRLYRADSSYARLQMTIVNPHWERTLALDMWTLGMEKTFIRILAPAKDQGVATLRMGTEMWNYFPKIDKVMKVPPSMMMGAWMGSDFTNDDLVKESTLLEDYSAELIPPSAEAAGAGPVYCIRLTPKARTATVWAGIVLTMDARSLLPLHEEYVDEKGRKMRRIEYREVKELGGRRMPTRLELFSLSKPGNKTVIEYQRAEFNAKVSDSVFSLRNLQKR